jgi:hypothetical protein
VRLQWPALENEDDVTVYAYKMPHQGNFVTRAMSEPWYDLTADTEDELHAFAAQLEPLAGETELCGECV